MFRSPRPAPRGGSPPGGSVTHPRNGRRRTLAVLLTTAMAATATSLAFSAPASAEPVPQAPKDAPADTLGAHDMDLLAEARAKQREDGHADRRDRQGRGRRRRQGAQGARRRQSPSARTSVGYVRAQRAHRRGAAGRQAPRRRRDRPRRDRSRCPTPDPSEQARSATKAAAAVAGARRRHTGGQPVHADARDRRRRLQEGPPDVGRPRRHDRHPGLRRRPRQPGAADHVDRRAQDRRLGHRHRPAASTATSPGGRC